MLLDLSLLWTFGQTVWWGRENPEIATLAHAHDVGRVAFSFCMRSGAKKNNDNDEITAIPRKNKL